jgi:hypothetical protein
MQIGQFCPKNIIGWETVVQKNSRPSGALARPQPGQCHRARRAQEQQAGRRFRATGRRFVAGGIRAGISGDRVAAGIAGGIWSGIIRAAGDQYRFGSHLAVRRCARGV